MYKAAEIRRDRWLPRGPGYVYQSAPAPMRLLISY